MKISLKKNNLDILISWTIILFPLINILVATMNSGDGLFILYIAYSMLFFLELLIKKCSKKNVSVNKINIYLFFFLFIEGFFVYFISSGTSSINDYILFSFCVIFWIVFSDETLIDKFEDFFYINKNKIFTIQMCYYFVLLISVMSGSGVDLEAWGTVTLKGPYGINHLLAYELTFFLIIDVIYWMKKNTFISMAFAFFNFILILLTGVRGCLLAVVAILFFTFSVQKTKKQMSIIVLGIIMLAYLFYKTDIFSALIEKTNSAIAIGSATNGRGKIFYSSLLAYFRTDGILSWIVGIGHDSLLYFNRQNIRLSIHAHNDFIDALVQYGIVGISIYIISLKKFFVRTRKIYWYSLFVFLCLAGFNGYYMYQSGVILSPILLIYARTMYEAKEKKQKNVV